MKNTTTKDFVMNRVRIIIFAKAPQPGYAKTRLIPALGQEGTAVLARQMLLHTLQEAIAADLGIVELCVTPAINDVAWQGIQLPSCIELSCQGEGDLGERMARATRRCIEQDQPVLLIGTDCVEMSSELLRKAALALLERDAVIHCTTDGGYALLGLKQFSHFLFSRMQWSSEEVASSTISRLGQLGWTVHVGEMLHDIDEPQDLKYLPEAWDSHVAA